MSVPATPAPLKRPEEKLPLGTRLAFGAGDLGPAIATIVVSFFQLFFLTTVAGLHPATAGTILLIGTVWDAISDPVMGWVSDHTRSRFGRRRPWLLYGSVPFGLIFCLQWVVPPFGEIGTVIYYVVLVVLFKTVFTVVAVPYTSLTPELTPNYDERTRLNSYRFTFSIGGSLLGLILHQTIVGLFADEQTGYLVAGAVLGFICVLPFLWCFAGVREHYQPPQVATELSLGQQIRFIFGNIPYLFVIGIYLCSWLAVQITAAVLPFYIEYWLQTPDLRLAIIGAVQGTAMVFLFVWGFVSSKIGKKAVYLIGMIFWIGVQLVLFFVQPDQLGLAFGLALLAGVGVATAYLIPWSMMPDVMEYDELRTGQRREGIFYGFMVFAQKLGIGLGIFLVGQILGAQGFDQNLAAGQQPESALTAIRVMLGPAPAVMLILGIVLAAFYPITRTKHLELRAQIEQRQSNKQQ